MRPILLAAAGLGCAAAQGANVYMLSSGDPATDSAASAALSARGHTVTTGVQYTAFDGSQSLAGFDTVYVQANANWIAGSMPPAGQQQLIAWVQAGGRLVTSEWVGYYSGPASAFGELGAILPIQQTFTYSSNATATYQVVTPDPVIGAGVPASFTFPLTSYTGTELRPVEKPGATVYYTSQLSATVGLAGWSQGGGRVFHFTSTCGPDQVADANFARLFANVMGAGGTGCYPNCDGSTQAPVLNVQDFSCFLTRYAGGEQYANCDQSTQPPVLNVQDFSCFLTRYAAGCS